MKIRIGISLGDTFVSEDPEALLEFVDQCETWDIDSLWVSDRMIAPKATLEPIVFLSYLAARMRNMKFGTSALVLPTRNPIVLAKQLASLDFLAKGRLLLAVGLGSDDSGDFDAVGIRKEERGKRADEMIVLLKKLWSEEHVNFDGRFYAAENLTLFPRPYQNGGPPVWVGGRSLAALRRAGRLADGWLTSHCTPSEVAAGVAAIRKYAAESARQVPDDHYGVLVPFFFASNLEEALAVAGPSIRRRPEVSLTDYSALGTPVEVRDKLREYIRVGVTKFVMRPCGPKKSFQKQVKLLAQEVVQSLQTPFSPDERLERLG
jgi:probable F420-dependent oxidoreductase